MVSGDSAAAFRCKSAHATRSSPSRRTAIDVASRCVAGASLARLFGEAGTGGAITNAAAQSCAPGDQATLNSVRLASSSWRLA